MNYTCYVKKMILRRAFLVLFISSLLSFFIFDVDNVRNMFEAIVFV